MSWLASNWDAIYALVGVVVGALLKIPSPRKGK